MNVYFDRYAYPAQLFHQPPDPALKIIAVIPCFNEPDITSTLNSLNQCKVIDKVEVILVVNESEHADEQTRQNNLDTIKAVEAWRAGTRPWFNLLVSHLKLRAKDAGVGLARKAGMDEAARRFEAINRPQGVIACFDADSTCATDYFTAIEEAYYKAVDSPVGSSIYFEHPFPQDPNLRKGIIQYELHLRYYVHALRWIGYPYSHQTVGSSMVVRSDIYQKIGGMNKRKAGEDFYFLHRLIPAGRFTDINSTCIYPSPRISQRVPFGTGKAMEIWQESKAESYQTYNLNSFRALGELFRQVDSLYDNELETIMPTVDPAVREFMLSENFSEVLKRLHKQSSSKDQFRKNFFAYFDGFKVLKFLHYSRDHHYPNQPVVAEADKLAEMIFPKISSEQTSPEEMLEIYRSKDRLKQAEHI